ncbi:hypothetical protein IH981_01290 [Patescibacteria group bacterium]|nr:hypothetical protein [Patescibacteria group bacterium]
MPNAAIAKLGVGVGLGKINIDEELTPGGIYKLPSLPVLNTGDEAADYEVEVTFLSEQEQRQPEASWFSFQPQSFHLEAGKSQTVEVSLTLPVSTRAGDYFAFLEAHPVKKGEGVTIGIAAATKLNFTVKPAGILGAIIERIRTFLENNSPASYYVLGAVGVVVLTLIGRRYLDLRIGLKKKTKKGG